MSYRTFRYMPQMSQKLILFICFKVNKTLYRALTRRGYTNTHITVYDTYSTQLLSLRFKVVPELSGKGEYEREGLTHAVLNAVLYK
jgi:hypothetical protein